MISLLFIIFFIFILFRILKLFICQHFSLNMMIFRLNRDTKASALSRNEIDKFVRKSRVKKKDKDKISALRDSSMRDSRSSRDFVSESEF